MVCVVSLSYTWVCSLYTLTLSAWSAGLYDNLA